MKDYLTFIDEPEFFLQDTCIRQTFFIYEKHNRPEEFTVLFSMHRENAKEETYEPALFISSHIPEKDARKFEKAIRAFSSSKYLDGKAQDKRWEKISELFGKAGQSAAISAFRYTHGRTIY